MSSLLNWLYIDFNSYFASVEQHLNPRLRGRPIAVVPMLTDSTCVIAASYEAKKYGIKTGTIVRDAKRMCPGLVCIAGNHSEYAKYHKQVIEAVESCHPVTAVCSIDEIACRLGGRDQNPTNAILLANEIKQKIYTQVGTSFSCSIGLSTNRFLAKVATDMQKPNGLVTIAKSDLPHKLYPLKLRDIIGIGESMEVRLNQKSIRTVEQLCALSMHELRAIWGGIGGERFYNWLRGVDLELTCRENQSMSHQHVLPPMDRSMDGVYRVAQKLLNKTAIRLRKLDLWARHMGVKVRFLDRPSWLSDVKMLECQDTFTLQEVLDQMWVEIPYGTPVKVSVVLNDLIHNTERSFSFFENPKRIHLSHTMDSINRRFGKNTVHLGSIHESLDSAPTRIAFSSIPDFDI
jgi:DNA polymerase-4